jgi:hypothetical protein
MAINRHRRASAIILAKPQTLATLSPWDFPSTTVINKDSFDHDAPGRHRKAGLLLVAAGWAGHKPDETRHNMDMMTNLEVSERVLSAWTVLEVLTPQPLPSKEELEVGGRKLIEPNESAEPWTQKRFSKRENERAVFWWVYLGQLELEKSVRSLLDRFPDEYADERGDVSGKSPIAVLVLDGSGRLVRQKTFLSSFAWGYGQVLLGNVHGLANFVDVEQQLSAELEESLIQQGDSGKILPLSQNLLTEACRSLIEQLNLPKAEVERSYFSIRVPVRRAYDDAPEPELLNSFFIEDLVRVRSELGSGRVGEALKRYLRRQPRREPADVLTRPEVLKNFFAPTQFPCARWPAKGRYPLTFMQQVAVNHAAAELQQSGLVAVNGPPGTGKTTLLRDLVSHIVLQRARALSTFDDPAMAFTHQRGCQLRTGQAYTQLYQLDSRLIGYEIVVASSNNKAVENISREIPSIDAITPELQPPLRYFAPIADRLAGDDHAASPGATWGLAAAVLGNSGNRYTFTERVWWDQERSLSRHLGCLTGARADDKPAEDSHGLKSLDALYGEANEVGPPENQADALRRWREARESFLATLGRVEALVTLFQGAWEKQSALKDLRLSECGAADAVARLIEAHRQAVGAVKSGHPEHERLRLCLRACEEDRRAAELERPGFLARLFGSESWKDWSGRFRLLSDQVTAARREFDGVESKRAAAEQRRAETTQQLVTAEQNLRDVREKIESAESQILAAQNLAGDHFPDDAFWNLKDEALQLTSPWMCPAFGTARDELFAAAFRLHRAFIDAAAKPLRHNFRAALELLRGRQLNQQQDALRSSIWASLFLVVPLVSTTFASVSRMFGSLGQESLGWLFVDEAGQSVPQAVVGALWRAKRAVIVGDPFQIPPVVTIPPRLIASIFSEFGLDHERWSAPSVSVQVLADEASWLGASFETPDGSSWVGSPLRVHRRCEEPMFTISNRIAYRGTMVSATVPGSSPIGEVLGESAWFDQPSIAASKWSPEEGKVARELLECLLSCGLSSPDIYFITPFRIIGQRLRELLANAPEIRGRLPANPWNWVRERVGTVHTFQGKEAEAVVLVLGASGPGDAGARRWAGKTPNLLNVAVSRAKRRLYVIGNREAWQGVGVFREAVKRLPVRSHDGRMVSGTRKISRPESS